tara:strand:+ start:94 stop:504 length:411 start_codon:yes stop_codon:yes gene_type:complete
MRILILLLTVLTTSNLLAIGKDQLISVNDLDYLFKNNIKKWNQSVVFFDKKKSMVKMNTDDEIYFLKSLFKNGSVIIKPYFYNNKVSKIDLEYEFESFDQNLKNLIFKHYTILENNYCTSVVDKKNKIIIKIIKCD